MALIEKLNAIGDAIRAKTGGTDKLTLDQMPTEIEGIQTGSGSTEVEPIVLTGNQPYGCCGKIASAYINMYGDTITTTGLGDTQYMFQNFTCEEIPFDINYNNLASRNMTYMFYHCANLKELPMINNARPTYFENLFCGCNQMRTIPESLGDNWDFSSTHSGTYYSSQGVFQDCYSLRKIPENFLKNLYTGGSGSYYQPYTNLFRNCHALDEVVGLSGSSTAAQTSGMFAGTTFENCNRLKKIVFATDDNGQPLVFKWKSQTIDLTNRVGHAYSDAAIISYNSGITTDKKVTSKEEYDALKNDPDWYAVNYYWSRYNHDSAVETINSLPDTSAYLATAGGTNTIKFQGASGELTDGGAINTLTEEEIAVATAKGWTVSFT